MTLLVQEYLKSGKSLEDLYTEHGVKSNITNNKISLNYDQIEASNGDPLACQCRGLILRENTYEIVACPMFRFFNIEQKEFAADIDWSSAAYEEKLDGTCLIVYFDDLQNTWCSATRSRSEADCGIDGSDVTFSMLANEICKSMFNKIHSDNSNKNLNDLMDATQRLHPEINIKTKTFIFELTSPINRIVCQYNDSKLTLLAVRDNISLEEEDPNFWNAKEEFGILTPQLYYFNDVSNMIEVIRSWDPKEHEGVVVKDKYWNRIKVKNPAYLAYNHMRDSLATSMRGCAEVILLGKDDDDVVGMMPDMIANRILKLKPAIAKVIEITTKDYDELKHIENMKEFALEAQKRLWPAALFALKRGKTKDLREFSLGNRIDVSKIPQNATDSILELAKKVDPEIGKLMI